MIRKIITSHSFQSLSLIQWISSSSSIYPYRLGGGIIKKQCLRREAEMIALYNSLLNNGKEVLEKVTASQNLSTKIIEARREQK